MTTSNDSASRLHAGPGPRAARAIAWVSLGFVLLGLTLPIAYFLPPFALYREALLALVQDRALVGGSPTLSLILGMTGGSIAGKWVAHYAVARLGLVRSEAWAVRATLAGLLGWFFLDSAASLVYGAAANVWMINPMPLLLVVPLLARGFREREELPAPPLRPALQLALGASVLGAGTGLMIALSGDGLPFAPWRAALSDAHFHGTPVPDSARALLRFFLGPIGGSTFGHFILVSYLVRYAPQLGERRALGWAALSVITWCAFDSVISLSCGAAFNVWMVNLPALALTALPLAYAFCTAPKRGDRRGAA